MNQQSIRTNNHLTMTTIPNCNTLDNIIHFKNIIRFQELSEATMYITKAEHSAKYTYLAGRTF
jgi:hypothetical protein